MSAIDLGNIDIEMRNEETNNYQYVPLKSQHKPITFPQANGGSQNDEGRLHLGSLEINFLKAAHESIISTFKLNKRYIEKELSQLFQNAKKLKKSSKDNADLSISGIDELIQQIDQIKQQYQTMCEVEDGLISSIEQRMKHLARVSSNINYESGEIQDPLIHQEYFETRLTRTIIDWMAQNQHFESARQLSKQCKLAPFSDLHLFIETDEVLQKLRMMTTDQQGSSDRADEALEKALAWCNTYKTKLQNSGSQLEFNLRLLQFIEMVKKNQGIEATKYAQENFRKFIVTQNNEQTDTQREQRSLIYRAMGLIGIQQGLRHKFDSYRYFTNKQRWIEIQELFLEEASNLFHISKTPLLENTLHVGLSSLKSVFWQNYHQEQKESKIQLGEEKDPQEDVMALINSKTKHLESQCPGYDPLINKLASPLKYAQQSQTKMKCKLTGKIMNDQDPPMWIPLNPRRYDLSEKQKEELKKVNSLSQATLNAEQKIAKGFLICKSEYDKIGDQFVTQKSAKEHNDRDSPQKKKENDPKDIFSLTNKDDKESIKVIKCPLTGDFVEKSKVRRVYFC